MAIQRLSYFKTIALACFAFAFTGLGLIGIFDGYIDAPVRWLGRASISGDPLQFWVISVLYFALAAVCGYFAVVAAPKRSAA